MVYGMQTVCVPVERIRRQCHTQKLMDETADTKFDTQTNEEK